MQQEKQLTTQARKLSPYWDDSKTKVWVVKVGIDKYYLTGTQLQYYLKTKEAGATHCVFGDFGLATNYQSYKLDWEVLGEMRKNERIADNQSRFEANYPKISEESMEENKKAWEELRKKIGKVTK